jgi:hypothetical protein
MRMRWPAMDLTPVRPSGWAAAVALGGTNPFGSVDFNPTLMCARDGRMVHVLHRASADSGLSGIIADISVRCWFSAPIALHADDHGTIQPRA